MGIIDKIGKKLNSQYVTMKNAITQKKFIDTLSNIGIKYVFILVIKGGKLEYKFLMWLRKFNPISII